MKPQTLTFKTFDFVELSDEVQSKIIDSTIEFVLSTTKYEEMSDNMKKAVDTADRLLTPWFTAGYVWDYCREEILDEWIPEDGFLEDGALLASLENFTVDEEVVTF